MKKMLALALLIAVTGSAEEFQKLPEWARPHAEAASKEAAPAEADAWVVLDRTEIAYAGEGEVRTRKLRLVKVLTERGLAARVFWLGGLGGKSSKVKKLKGWNLRPDGELVKLDTDSVVTVDTDSFTEEITTGTLTGASLDRVEKGSWIAFESLQVFRHPMGPVDGMMILEGHPIRRFELALAKKEGWFTDLKQVEVQMDMRHFAPWIPVDRMEQVPGNRLAAWNLPALPKGEGAHPHPRNMLPQVLVRFQDPNLKEQPSYSSWESLGTAFSKRYAAFLQPIPLTLEGSDPRARLNALHRWMGRELTYKQVYLTPDRGWIPESPAEVHRKRFGDCKDLSTFFMAQALGQGLKVAPALARIVDGVIEADEPVFFGAFNHVIAAIRLDQSWGMPAEVETPKGRFLLVDETAPLTPLGLLPRGHGGRRVLICLEDGGVWAEIPSTAVQVSELDILLKGQSTLAGELTAEFRIREGADAWGLRAAAIHQGKAKLREFVLRNLEDLPPTGSLEVKEIGDPWDLDKPFEVALNLKYPAGLRSSGNEVTLMNWGMVRLPGVIQKPGTPRQFPVQAGYRHRFRYRAEVEVSSKLMPLLAEEKLESLWRQASWKAELKSEAGTHRLCLDYQEEGRGVLFGFEKREEGLSAWKKDRAGVRRLLQEGLVFRVQ